MTVIISAICDSETEPAIVVASDCMSTVGHADLSIRIDGCQKKMFHAARNALVLQSGSTQDAEIVIANAKADAKEDVDVAELFNALKEAAWNRTTTKRLEFLKTTLGYEVKLDELPASVPGTRLYDMWIKALETVNAGTYLIAGFMSEGSPALYAVNSVSMANCHRVHLPYATDGSGQHFANASLVSNWPSSPARLADVLYRVYCAKKAAEVSDGVGVQTDMAVLSPTYHDITGLVQQLEALRKKRQCLSDDDANELMLGLSAVNWKTGGMREA